MSKKFKKSLPTTDVKVMFKTPAVWMTFQAFLYTVAREFPEVSDPKFSTRKDDFANFVMSLLRVNYFANSTAEDIISDPSVQPVINPDSLS